MPWTDEEREEETGGRKGLCARVRVESLVPGCGAENCFWGLEKENRHGNKKVNKRNRNITLWISAPF